MLTKLSVVLLLSLCACFTAVSQSTDTLIRKLDSLHRVEQRPENKRPPETDPEDYTSQTNITFKGYFVLLGTNMVQEITGPFRTSKETWIKVVGFAVLEGALLFADRHIQKASYDFMERNPSLKSTSQYITNFGDSYQGVIVLAFGAYGLITNNNKMKTTTLLATQPYLASAGMSTLVKMAVGRYRPHSFAPGEEHHLKFKGPGFGTRGSSFPSGHTTAAFSAATVFAEEYRDKPIVPIIAYSMATLVGITRITQNAHWATDVLAGAALGYVTGKQVVRNYHRYARIRNNQQKTSLHFNVNYLDGMIMPQLVYKF